MIRKPHDGQSFCDPGTSFESTKSGPTPIKPVAGNAVRVVKGPSIHNTGEPVGPKGAPYREKGADESK